MLIATRLELGASRVHAASGGGTGALIATLRVSDADGGGLALSARPAKHGTPINSLTGRVPNRPE